MKMVQAIFRPSKLDEVKEGLSRIGVQGVTVSEVKGAGRQKSHVGRYRGAEYQIDFHPNVMLEVVVNEDSAQEVLDAISGAAKTGGVGDGNIFLLQVDEVIRIRTGERGPRAI